MATLNGKEGVWRTVGGRRIFIANGQSLKDAMRASGKFSNLKDDESNMDRNLLNKANEFNLKGYDTEEDGIDEFAEQEGISRTKAKAYLEKAKEEYFKDNTKNSNEDSREVNNKTIQMKGGDKTEYKVLDESTDSAGEKIYKVMENGQEKWVQGDLFIEKDWNSGIKSLADVNARAKRNEPITQEDKNAIDAFAKSQYPNMSEAKAKELAAMTAFGGDKAKVREYMEFEANKAVKEYKKYETEYNKYSDLARQAGYGTEEYNKYAAKRSALYEKMKQAKETALTEFHKTVPYDEMFDAGKAISGAKNAKFGEPELALRDGKAYIRYSSNDIKQDAGVFGSILRSAKLEQFNSELYIDDKGQMNYWGSMDIKYQHNGGGSNGMEIMQYRYNSKTGWDITDSAGYKYKNGKKITTVSALADYYVEYYGYSKENAKIMAQARMDDLKRNEAMVD